MVNSLHALCRLWSNSLDKHKPYVDSTGIRAEHPVSLQHLRCLQFCMQSDIMLPAANSRNVRVTLDQQCAGRTAPAGHKPPLLVPKVRPLLLLG
jgi:hypothetical protein